MKSYPIWNEVTACIYKNSKSYGAKKVNKFTQFVGSSKNNCVTQCNFKTIKTISIETIIFTTFINDLPIIKTVFSSKDGKADKFISQTTYLGQEKP